MSIIWKVLRRNYFSVGWSKKYWIFGLKKTYAWKSFKQKFYIISIPTLNKKEMQQQKITRI